MATAWASLSWLERMVVAIALLVLLLTAVTSSGILPQRSFASMTAGFVMLGASGIELLCVCWLVATHLLVRRRLERRSFAVVLVGIVGATPVLVVAVRLLAE
jgi:hypothetical protein